MTQLIEDPLEERQLSIRHSTNECVILIEGGEQKSLNNAMCIGRVLQNPSKTHTTGGFEFLMRWVTHGVPSTVCVLEEFC